MGKSDDGRPIAPLAGRRGSTKTTEAIRYAESCRGPWTSDADVNRICEEILPGSSGAALVGVNIGDERERPSAERLASDVARLRADEELCRDILSWRGRRGRVTVAVANTGKRGDPGLKKAPARVRRAVRT